MIETRLALYLRVQEHRSARPRRLLAVDERPWGAPLPIPRSEPLQRLPLAGVGPPRRVGTPIYRRRRVRVAFQCPCVDFWRPQATVGELKMLRGGCGPPRRGRWLPAPRIDANGPRIDTDGFSGGRTSKGGACRRPNGPIRAGRSLTRGGRSLTQVAESRCWPRGLGRSSVARTRLPHDRRRN
jgi:hypothetical protein